jgi:hypothetical protein
MPYATANQIAVIDGRLTLPESGRGVAVLRLTQPLETEPFAVGTAVSLEFEDGTTYVMTAKRVQPKGGFWVVLLVQGAGNLEMNVRAKEYEGIGISTIVRDAVLEAGESVTEVVVAGILPKHIRRRSSLARILETVLANKPERFWFEKNGGMTVKQPNFDLLELEPTAFESRPETRSFVLPILPSLEPRCTLRLEYAGTVYRERISRVIHHIGTQLRTEAVWATESDHISALERLTEDARLVYALSYPCRILKDHGNNRFDVQPDDDSLPTLTRVPWRAFAPGVLLEVLPNTRAVLRFMEGDSSQPALLEFETGGIKNIVLPAQSNLKLGGSSALLGVVRTNDQVDVTIFVAPSLLGKLSATPSLEPQPVGPPLPFVPITVQGVNIGGSSIVKAVD